MDANSIETNIKLIIFSASSLHLIHISQGKHKMKLSKTTSHSIINFHVRLTIICCLFIYSLITHANEEVMTSQLKNVTTIESSQVNINTASAEQISALLKGIGLKKADAIIEYRNNYGPFQTIDELSAVSGIGNATIEKNAHLIAIN